ncbi:hypothetical protein HZU73_09230 [Apis mellifera caucasica]|uniref:Uncharacterized protein LOC725712 n=1 Tax=Apis mellifera TaxID=7460 RepID=A0A7M7GZT5_APIME|nr:uncharacterized protein LOC725712 [Apis mellifera]KAG6795447.1 hypothetical protein HZU73_09230 [Apis mellifera caucasica]KAG9438212.1 hypothetical protein HZU67_01222 [Apis mellifera carnica]|eukprot:XP_006571525.1 uncharacterized protein LOC725712 [Apis mellifera]
MAPSKSDNDVKVMSIGGRVTNERERLIGMLEEERQWRARFLKSQNLAPDEPLMTKEYYKQLYNPFRRFYKLPFNKFEALLSPLIGKTPAVVIRNTTSKLIMTIVGIYCGWYYFKYNTYTWMKQSGWRQINTRDAAIPGIKNYKGLEKPKAFATNNFENSPI